MTGSAAGGKPKQSLKIAADKGVAEIHERRVDSVMAMMASVGPPEETSNLSARVDKPQRKAILLGPFALEVEVTRRARAWQTRLEEHLGVEIQMQIATPPYEMDNDVECKGYWVRPVHAKHDEKLKVLRKQIYARLVEFLTQAERCRPRLCVGLGQGGLIIAMSTFPVILEKSYRARAVTQSQTRTCREAWSGVAALLVIDPVILPANNNTKAATFQILSDARPEMDWAQPRGNRRAMVMQHRYFMPQFAEELGAAMGRAPEREILSDESFLSEALRPPPLHFECEDKSLAGVCCVRYKKRMLGRCPSPDANC